MSSDLQTPFDVAVVTVTVVRDTLVQAIRSVFAQAFAGRIQILVGIDRLGGDRAIVDQLGAQAPSHVAISTLDLGYSTSQRHGGLYPSHYGGALKTILSYAANSRHVTYLDDDNWYAPEHLASLLDAVRGNAWAYALRRFVDASSGDVLCDDTWESLGPDRGVYAKAQGGFVDTNCILLDKFACHDAFPEWAVTRYAGGTGGDRQVLEKVRNRPFDTNERHSVYYRTRLDALHPYLLWRFKCAGVDLGRYLAPHALPGEAVWRQCAEHDRQNRFEQASAA